MWTPPESEQGFVDLLFSLTLAFSGDIIRVGIAEAAIASQNRRSTFFYCTEAAIPDHAVFANRDHRAPGGLRFRRLKLEEHAGKKNGGNQNQASHCRPPCSMPH